VNHYGGNYLTLKITKSKFSILSLKLHCKYQKIGCKEIVTLERIEAHEMICSHKPKYGLAFYF
jgi:hypothetical protein